MILPLWPARTAETARAARASRRGARVFTLACLSLAASSASPAMAWAQFPDLVDMSAQYMPGAALEDPRPVKAQVTSYDVSLNVPIPLGKRTFLIPGLAYHVDSVSFADAPPGFTELRAFQSLDLSLLFVQLLPQDWALSLRAAPGIAGDFQGLDAGHFRISAVALATRSFSDRLVLGGGGVATFSFGSFLPLPAVYLEWKPWRGLQIEGFIPAFINTKYTIEDRVELGLRAEVAGNAYAVRDERVAAAWPCVPAAMDHPAIQEGEGGAQPTQCLDHIAYSVITAGPAVGVRLFKSVWWTTFAGHSVFRRFEQMNDEDDHVVGGAQDLPDVFFFRTGLTWRIPRD
jgi:hypothetical protein